GDATGSIATASCLTHECAQSALGLIDSGPEGNRCFSCLLYYAISEVPLEQGQTACTQSSTRPYAFGGQTPSMVLSRYPFASAPQAYILPSTGWRRAVIYAPLQLEDQVVDFYCAQLSSSTIASELPYAGDYGPNGEDRDAGAGGVSGWEKEQQVQVAQVVSFVQKTSAASGRPAIIAGDWHSSAAASATLEGGTVPALADVAPEILRALDASLGGAFLRAEPPGYTASCEFCPAPTNVYNGSVQPADFTPTFLIGFPATSVVSDALWATEESVVPLSPAIKDEPCPTSSCTGPISQYFPRSVQILRPIVP
ncbi:MAG: hypothetical protein ACRELB_17810, partial [Polyangiaceae bacterium]